MGRNVSGMNAYTFYGLYEYYSFRDFSTENSVPVDGMRLEGNRCYDNFTNHFHAFFLAGPDHDSALAVSKRGRPATGSRNR